MKKIRLLDEETINKIAAGEVIERPASVVKELVENSIDAGASKILVEVLDGGKSLIKVTDDGCGIQPEDLPLTFQKHATSKIHGANDLENIKTLGFRGEALSSIASVSRNVEVRTKTLSALSGVYMRLENGKIKEIKEAGCPSGTSIVVFDLFHNVPARQKHLKGSEAELTHIIDLIMEISIINYHISFELFSERRTLFKSIKSQSWNDVLIRILGSKTLKSMMPLNAESVNWRLRGLIGDPLNTRSDNNRIFIYVNSRAVASRILLGALRDAYKNVIPVWRSPIAVLSLETSPQLVDVNVHPAKKEIRLLEEEEISRNLTEAVIEALRIHAKIWPQEISCPVLSNGIALIAEDSKQQTLSSALEGEKVEIPKANNETSRLRVLGQILDLYIVAEGDQGLMLVDQHAAAERIRFEHLQDLYAKRSISQELAEPIAIELSPSEQILIESWQETLKEIGFEITPFGGNAYSVRAVPALGKRLESAEAVHDILADLFVKGKIDSQSTSRDNILRLLACKGSIKSGREMNIAEMHGLLKDLYACKNTLTCPHGRPITVVINQNQLEKLFSRR